MLGAYRNILVLVLVEFSMAAIFNDSIIDIKNNALEKDIDERAMRRLAAVIRRKKKKDERSTSSSSNEVHSKGKSEDYSSIQISASSSSTDTDEKKYVAYGKKDDAIKSSRERKGWRKYHRKCTPCPEDMRLKWRDPRITWICGGYQRARRSFKSSCMMYYRNCQDGTMFTKVSEGRCKNSTEDFKHGDHFFYDYQVHLSDETKSTTSESDESPKHSSSESFDAKKHGIP